MKIADALKLVGQKENSLTHEVQKMVQRIRPRASKYEDELKSLEEGSVEAQKQKVTELVQGAVQRVRNISLLTAKIAEANANTQLTLEIGGIPTTKSISYWLSRKERGIELERQVLKNLVAVPQMPNRIVEENGTKRIANVVRFFAEAERDKLLDLLDEELRLIDRELDKFNFETTIEE